VTYFQFLAVFLVPPVFVLLLALRRLERGALAALTLTATVAVLYTAPWDNLIGLNGVWSWRPDRVTGLTFGMVPVEEYCFFVLQTFVAGLFAYWVLRRR
jgi:putative membrane protein